MEAPAATIVHWPPHHEFTGEMTEQTFQLHDHIFTCTEMMSEISFSIQTRAWPSTKPVKMQ
jgi:hypothetical protein